MTVSLATVWCTWPFTRRSLTVNHDRRTRPPPFNEHTHSTVINHITSLMDGRMTVTNEHSVTLQQWRNSYMHMVGRWLREKLDRRRAPKNFDTGDIGTVYRNSRAEWQARKICSVTADFQLYCSKQVLQTVSIQKLYSFSVQLLFMFMYNNSE